jgi:hypothetical protein
VRLNSERVEAYPKQKSIFYTVPLEGHPGPGAMKRPWNTEAPKELWRDISTSWSRGDNPWVLLGVVMAVKAIASR